jgi:hypothetical protein
MAIKLTDLIERVPREVESKVQRICDDAGQTVRDALRSECGLVMRTQEEKEQKRPGAQAPVKVTAGHPLALEQIAFPSDIMRILLLGRYRTALEQARDCVPALLELHGDLAGLTGPAKGTAPANAADLQSAGRWAAALLKELNENDPLRKVLMVSEDFLGVYTYDTQHLFDDQFAVNTASIRLYWGVIGLVSQWLGCAVEDLAVVVLTHELAHAYTQLGADIEGRRWAARVFARVETPLAEGLAQYYTDRVLHRLERRYPGALKVFLRMLPSQPAAYRSHEPWIDKFSPEAVRVAMLEVRRQGEVRLEDFNKRLGAAQDDLGPQR